MNDRVKRIHNLSDKINNKIQHDTSRKNKTIIK